MNKILQSEPLGLSRCLADYVVYIWSYEDKDIVIINLSIDDFLLASWNEVPSFFN